MSDKETGKEDYDKDFFHQNSSEISAPTYNLTFV